MAYFAVGHFVLERQNAYIYDFNSLQDWQAPLIGDFIIVFLYAPVYSLLEEILADALAVFALPASHRKRLQITNGLERFQP